MCCFFEFFDWAILRWAMVCWGMVIKRGWNGVLVVKNREYRWLNMITRDWLWMITIRHGQMWFNMIRAPITVDLTLTVWYLKLSSTTLKLNWLDSYQPTSILKCWWFHIYLLGFAYKRMEVASSKHWDVNFTLPRLSQAQAVGCFMVVGTRLQAAFRSIETGCFPVTCPKARR